MTKLNVQDNIYAMAHEGKDWRESKLTAKDLKLALEIMRKGQKELTGFGSVPPVDEEPSPPIYICDQCNSAYFFPRCEHTIEKCNLEIVRKIHET
jgi:hypothetical protein